MSVTYHSSFARAEEAIRSAGKSWTAAAAEKVRRAAAERSPVDTGALRASWRVKKGEKQARVGSALPYAIYQETGTGLYALSGGGRKTPWVYRDEAGAWHTTRGSQPRRMLERGYEREKTALRRLLENTLKEVIGR